MLRRVLLIFGLVVTCAALASAADVNGKWEGAVQTPDGDLLITFVFKAEGDALTGTVESVMGLAQLKNGKIAGDVLTFDVELEAMTITHEATVTGDEIAIKAKGDWGESEYVVKRVKP
jgi:hypothetical protein